MPEANLGGNSGSREPDPSSTGSGPTGFDPGRFVELAERCEKATGHDRTLEQDIHDAIFGLQYLENWGQTDGSRILPYTTSLDAAVTLVPENWLLDYIQDGREDHPTYRPPTGICSARLYYFRRNEADPRKRENLKWGKGQSRALALCAAALRARAATPPSDLSE